MDFEEVQIFQKDILCLNDMIRNCKPDDSRRSELVKMIDLFFEYRSDTPAMIAKWKENRNWFEELKHSEPPKVVSEQSAPDSSTERTVKPVDTDRSNCQKSEAEPLPESPKDTKVDKAESIGSQEFQLTTFRSSYEHSRRDPSDSKPSSRKDNICDWYSATGYCKFGSKCHFVHSDSSTADKRKLLCWHYLSNSCRNGRNCLYLHEQFPCFMYHLGSRCYLQSNCTFSHDPLTLLTEQAFKNALNNDFTRFRLDSIYYENLDKMAKGQKHIIDMHYKPLDVMYECYLDRLIPLSFLFLKEMSLNDACGKFCSKKKSMAKSRVFLYPEVNRNTFKSKQDSTLTGTKCDKSGTSKSKVFESVVSKSTKIEFKLKGILTNKNATKSKPEKKLVSSIEPKAPQIKVEKVDQEKDDNNNRKRAISQFNEESNHYDPSLEKKIKMESKQSASKALLNLEEISNDSLIELSKSMSDNETDASNVCRQESPNSSVISGPSDKASHPQRQIKDKIAELSERRNHLLITFLDCFSSDSDKANRIMQEMQYIEYAIKVFNSSDNSLSHSTSGSSTVPRSISSVNDQKASVDLLTPVFSSLVNQLTHQDPPRTECWSEAETRASSSSSSSSSPSPIEKQLMEMLYKAAEMIQKRKLKVPKHRNESADSSKYKLNLIDVPTRTDYTHLQQQFNTNVLYTNDPRLIKFFEPHNYKMASRNNVCLSPIGSIDENQTPMSPPEQSSSTVSSLPSAKPIPAFDLSKLNSEANETAIKLLNLIKQVRQP
jgi:hypothetical protein